jgi:hypothetical protein
VAILPEAPVTFSTRTGCPSDAFMYWARIRVLVSVGPPAAYPTTIVIGRDGYASALATRDVVEKAAAQAARCKSLRRPGRRGWPSSSLTDEGE